MFTYVAHWVINRQWQHASSGLATNPGAADHSDQAGKVRNIKTVYIQVWEGGQWAVNK